MKYRLPRREAVCRDNKLVRGVEQSFLPASRWILRRNETRVDLDGMITEPFSWEEGL